MGLTIELSFSVTHNTNVTQFKQYLTDLAKKYNNISSYFIHEIEGHSTTIDRNDCIQVVEFSLDCKNILNYIKNIMRVKSIKIDSIYLDRKGINLIYASKNYHATMSVNENSIFNKPINKTKLFELITKSMI
jgi:hypothetical protein